MPKAIPPGVLELLQEREWEEPRNSARMLEKVFARQGTTQKIRITVRLESYDFQSYARAHLFDPAQPAAGWVLLASLPYPQMEGNETSATGTRHYTAADLQTNARRLVADVATLLQ